MERANQSAHTSQFLVGMRRLTSVHEGENLDATLEAERTRCPFETHVVKVPQQRVYRRRPIPSAPTHSFATPHHRTQTAAETHSRSMAVGLLEWLKGHSGTLAQPNGLTSATFRDVRSEFTDFLALGQLPPSDGLSPERAQQYEEALKHLPKPTGEEAVALVDLLPTGRNNVFRPCLDARSHDRVVA